MSDETKKRVDEDWKRRVDQEKKQAEPASPARPPSVPPPAEQGATFASLVSSLATQAAMSMGLVADPEGAGHVDMKEAQYLIDLLEMLRSKTHGNLTPEEQEVLDGTVQELRMAFVSMVQRLAGKPKPPLR